MPRRSGISRGAVPLSHQVALAELLRVSVGCIGLAEQPLPVRHRPIHLRPATAGSGPAAVSRSVEARLKSAAAAAASASASAAAAAAAAALPLPTAIKFIEASTHVRWR